MITDLLRELTSWLGYLQRGSVLIQVITFVVIVLFFQEGDSLGATLSPRTAGTAYQLLGQDRRYLQVCVGHPNLHVYGCALLASCSR